MLAGSPPTVTETGSCGCGNLVIGVTELGVVPVASEGRTCPSPVTKRVVTCPPRALEKGALTNPFDMKMPGAACATWNLYETFAYGFPNRRVTCPVGVS